MIRMYGICLTVIALAVTVNAATKGAEISADSEFQKFRSQSSIRCSNNVGTGNQESKLLNTDAKRQAFRQKLTAEQQTFFDKLVNSPDHSVDTFTGDQLMMPLWKVMEDLTDSDRDMFIDIRSKWDTVTYDELVAFLGKIRPVELLVVKKELLCELTGKLDEAALDVVCGRVANDSVTDSEMAIAFEDRCSDCVALAWKKRASDNVRAIVSGAKGAFLYEKMAQTIPADQWDVNGLMLAPDAVTPEDVNRVPDANFCDSTQRDRLTKSEFHSVVSEDVKKAVARKLAKCSDLQDVGSWSAANIKKLSPYLANLPKTSLFKIKVSDAVDSLNELFALDKKTAEVIFKAMAPKLITYWTVNKAWTANQKTKILCIMVKYAPNKRFFEKVATVDDLKAFLRDKETQCPGQTFDSKEMRPITDRVASDDTFKWESDSFSDFGSSISSLSSSDLKKVNKSVICSDWDKVKDAHFKTQDLKHLWNVCKMEKSYSLGSFTCDKVKSIGVFLQAMTKAEIDEIPVNTLADCAEQVGKALNDVCKTNKGVCRAVWNRMKQKSDLDMADMLKKFKGASEFAKMVDVSKMNNLDIDQLGDMEGVAEVVDGTHKMAAAVVKSLKRKYGEVSDRNTNYTGQRFKKVVSLFIMGGRNDDIRRLPEDSTFVDGLKDVDVENMPQKKRQIVKEKLTKVYGLDEGSDVCVEPSIAQETAPFFADANKSLLTKFQAKSLRGLFKGLGKTMSALKKNTRAQMKLMTNAMSNIDNFGGKSSITMEDVAKYGPFMWCGASKELISKFEWDVFETFLEDIAQCASVHMDSDTKQAVVERLKNLADRNSVKISEEPERLASMGSLIYQYLATLQTDLANLSNDQKEALSTSTRSIFEGLARDREEKRLRNSKEVSEAEKTREHAEMVDLAAFLMGVMQNVKARNEKDGVDGGGLPMGGRRRKRATDTITCDLLQDFNGELSFLSAAQVDTMDAADFVNCLPEFQKTDFAADVLVSLAAKLKAGINSDTRTWTADDVIAAGRLLDSLDDADIDKLLLSDDTVTGIAQHVFTKKDKLLLRYLTNTSQTDTSALTANTLSTLGNLACGLTDSHITAIPASVISEASTDLGSVPCFSEAQLTAMGTKIAEALGNDWTSKDPVVVAELGLLAGGLPQNVLEDFGEDLIGSMTKEAVAAVPTSVFSTVFTTDKLAYLSPEQANEVTDAQIGSLTAAQLSTLSGITTINIDTIFGSGSAVPTASVTVMTILTIGWMLLQN